MKYNLNKASLVLDSGTTKPVETSNYYVAKDSVLGGAAPYIFAAIGSQYENDAKRAVSSKGTACSLTSTQETKSHTVSGAIDRVGMAAGMGLLTSQAKGEIKALKATFDVTEFENNLKGAKLKVIVKNQAEHKEVDITVPANFYINEEAI